ncbi:flagellar hook-associated protein FlgK [Caldibacillus lycopersici]|uniref:Flagellar hook-associated protein 1 n=1 Tax=Perspicuibacillus lycopersici TaxID=1325689 RepID=A0AAE3LLZ4_9BACI|nr:flagellar hook-associated protein FlgK [Perspicuibacillus lycopersici]MCU9612985.1 flagellar hook-associated protein FlgK [Perspicuibacillus lycopersici]
MISTFHGLETAKRGLNAQNAALTTNGNNVANANTAGYTRQKVNTVQTQPLTVGGMNQSQIGTGVEVQSIQRVRDQFLDAEYRQENGQLGYYNSLSSSLSQVENILNDTQGNGLNSVMDKFWSSMQDLTTNPDNLGVRQVVAANGQMVAETINYYYHSISTVQEDIGKQITSKVDQINSLVSQIDQLNDQIAKVETTGQLPNNLYDQRDVLVDNLSSIVDIKVTSVVPNNYAKKTTGAEGLYQIEIVQDNGASYSPQATLIQVDRTTGNSIANTVSVSGENGETNSLTSPITHLNVGESQITNMNFSGELGGLIESYGYQTADGVSGQIPEILEKLNNLASAFANEFNAVHEQGFGLNGETGLAFFELGETGQPAAKVIKVNSDILNNPSLLAVASGTASSEDFSNNENAVKLTNLQTKNFSEYVTNASLPANMQKGNISSYYSSIIGDIGVKVQGANSNLQTAQTLTELANNNRQSVNGVSLDEEMANLVMFQHAYNASARMVSVIDEMLDTIINGLGR